MDVGDRVCTHCSSLFEVVLVRVDREGLPSAIVILSPRDNKLVSTRSLIPRPDSCLSRLV
jgi:hypothetical protein